MDVSLHTYNSQYLQRRSTSAPAVLAAAKVAHTLLEEPMHEVEGIAFMTLDESASQTFDISVISFVFVLFLYN